jgi:hypothetical protein
MSILFIAKPVCLLFLPAELGRNGNAPMESFEYQLQGISVNGPLSDCFQVNYKGAL